MNLRARIAHLSIPEIERRRSVSIFGVALGDGVKTLIFEAAQQCTLIAALRLTIGIPYTEGGGDCGKDCNGCEGCTHDNAKVAKGPER